MFFLLLCQNWGNENKSQLLHQLVTVCFRWRVSPTPSSTSTPAPSLPSSSAAKPSKTSSVKRERSVAPEKQQEEKDEDEAISDTELMGSPKKRKKTGLFDGHLLEKVNNYPSHGEASEPELQFVDG